MKAKLLIVTGADKNVFSLFGDGEALIALGEALSREAGMEPTGRPPTRLYIPDAITGQETVWQVGRLPNFKERG